MADEKIQPIFSRGVELLLWWSMLHCMTLCLFTYKQCRLWRKTEDDMNIGRGSDRSQRSVWVIKTWYICMHVYVYIYIPYIFFTLYMCICAYVKFSKNKQCNASQKNTSGYIRFYFFYLSQEYLLSFTTDAEYRYIWCKKKKTNSEQERFSISI